MPSQFFGLNIAYTGLCAANASLNTTSNNIANVETKGYSRQAAVQRAADALRTFTTYGCAGAGVETLAIERVRDEFYDQKYWNSNTRVGEFDVKQYYMKQIENYLEDDPDKGVNGFNTIFETMNEALKEVMKTPGSSTVKKQFIGYANSLTDYMNDTAANLQKMQEDLNSEVMNKVNEINSIAQEITTLNQQINTIEVTGTSANELRDRRTLLVDQLSAIVDVEVKEIPVIDSKDPDRETGASRFQIKIAGGQTLVDTDRYNELECVVRKSDEKVNQSDADGLYDVRFKNSGLELNLYAGNLGGELKSLVQMRDGNNGDIFKGSIHGIGTKTIGATDYDTVTVDVTEGHLIDLNKCNLSDTGGYIKLGNQEFRYDSWSMTTTIAADGTKSASYTFVLSQDNEHSPDAGRIGLEAKIGAVSNYQGIPYYQAQLNEWTRTFSQCFNDILTQVGAVNEYGDNTSCLFVGDNPASTDQWRFTQQRWIENADGSKTMTVDSTGDNYYRLTAMTYGINKDLVKDAGLLATHTGGVDEESANDIIEELVKLPTNKDKMSFRNCTAGEFLECIQADIALNAESANTFYSSYSNISASINTQRISISGVDKDEEAINLVKYQNSYDLASKMIQTLSEVYDRLILQTGV